MNRELPDKAEIVVLGGGVIGLSVLYHLSLLGARDVVLLERNKLTSGTTWHSAANVRTLRPSRNLTRLINYGVQLFRGLEEETGQKVGWINEGSISLATCEDRLVDLRRQQSLSKFFGIASLEVSRDEVKERWPLVNTDDVLGGIWSPEDGRVSPSDLCAAFEKSAKSRGARVFENTPVSDFVVRDGICRSLICGEHSIDCNQVILCTGIWSREIGLKLGVDIPLYPCEHFYILTRPVEGITGNLPTLVDSDRELYIRDDSGGLLVGSFEERGKSISPETLGDDFAFGLLPEDWDHFEPMMLNALHRLPILETAEVKMLLNGPESFTLDNEFLLGESGEVRNCILGCGMNSIGVASSCGVGKMLAHKAIYGHLPMDLHESDPRRFYYGMNREEYLSVRVEEVLGRRFAIPYKDYQWQTARNIRFTPLHEEYVKEQAHFTQVFGWERALYLNEQEHSLTFSRPKWLDNVGQEVHRVSTDVGVFDLSMYGKILVEGADALKFINRVCSNNLDIRVGGITYTLILDDRGGIVGDVIVLRLEEQKFRIITGAVAIYHDFCLFRNSILSGEKVKLTDETEKFSILALMGPRSFEVLRTVGGDDLCDLKYFAHKEGYINDCRVRASRLSFVGEAGVEITVRSDCTVQVYDKLKEYGAKVVGYYAQESMRIEKGFLSYGHDMDSDDNPCQVGLEFAVGKDKENFVGREGFLKSDRELRIVTLICEDNDIFLWGNEPIEYEGVLIGETTSASYGFRVGALIAIARIRSSGYEFRGGEKVLVHAGGVKIEAEVKLGAVFDPKGDKMRNIGFTVTK